MRLKPSTIALLLAFILAACASAPPQPAGGGRPQALIALPTPVESAQASSETADLLRTTDVPVRDRIALAQRFLGLGEIPRSASAPPPVYTIGDTRGFTVENTDTDEQFTITARLVYVTEHAYWWVEEGFDVDGAGLARSAERFEGQIYPTTRRYFGSEWSPGVDNDPHVYILMAEQLGANVLGYFYSSSEYPRQAVPSSNEAEIFLVSVSNLAPYVGTDYFDSVLAHEFQHMIHWAVDVNEDSWANEGLSELSTLLNGFSFLSHIPSFMSNPATQLTHWPEDDPCGPHYGAGHLFFTYMLERFGEEAIVQVVREPANGMVGVQEALRAVGATDPLRGTPVSADDLFADWVVANYLNNANAGDGRYVYSLLPGLGTISPTQSYSVYPVYVEGREWPQYAADYIQLQGSGGVRFAFAGQPQVSLLPTSAHSGRYMFWGNRADDSDTTLTHAFDLTGTARATLEYWTWYHIEALWDYGYVTVSTDGGQTWTVLETPNTTRENPHSNAYGPGYTGRSGGDAEPVWTQERLDLTPYTGRQIMVRFEYVTDDLTLQPGFAIDDMAIPEIGYSEDFEGGDGGWESAGWIRHDNVLPQRFVVQMIEVYGDGTARVVRVLGPEDPPRRVWEIKLDGKVSEVVVVVSGLAPVTTEPAVYTFSVEPVTD
jgi:immune inhibitor A